MSSWMIIGILIIVAVVVWGLAKIAAVFVAVFLSLVVTSVLNPVVNWLDKFMPKWLGVLSSWLNSGGWRFPVAYVIPSVASQWDSLSRQFSSVDRSLKPEDQPV